MVKRLLSCQSAPHSCFVWTARRAAQKSQLYGAGCQQQRTARHALLTQSGLHLEQPSCAEAISVHCLVLNLLNLPPYMHV